MLLRIVGGVVLGLLIVVACDDDEKGDNGGQGAGSGKDEYKFALAGTEGLLNDGNGHVEVQLMKDGKAVTEAEAGIEVTLKVVCGDNSKEFKEKLGTDGKVDIAVDVSDAGWEVSDWGTCKVSAVAEVDSKEVEATEVEIKTIAGEGAVTEPCTENCDSDDDLPSFTIGEEIGQLSLGGTLSLHSCSSAVLYTIAAAGDTVSRDDDGTVTADDATKNFPVMFVLGTAGSKCKLQHTKDGKTSDYAKVVDAAANENPAAGHAIGLVQQGQALQITLPATEAPSFEVFASNSGGRESDKQPESKAQWNSTFTATTFFGADSPPYLGRSLLKVSPDSTNDDASTASTSNTKVWWHMYASHPYSIGAVKIGKVFTVNSTKDLGTNVKLKLSKGYDCGLHFFFADGDNVPQERIGADYPRNGWSMDGKSFKMLAVDGGTKSYAGNDCRVSMDINGATVVASSTAVDATRPKIDGITLQDSGDATSNKVKVTLPTQTLAAPTKVMATNNGFGNWKEWGAGNATLTWGRDYIFNGANQYDLDWHSSPVTENQAFVAVTVGSNEWWYYAEGK